ncbi:hypothetical protein POVCU2_0091140 [Plasmodium ovale curtisi]|uniref:Uncharacterized protein n=1 Tax=Plasmodium ovale curtisi TaxID=864141 RepID=A0A1A8WSM7_PLAOA|nr:hypothetical protein POVCU2_0091140 [Plasmodium ovale curtisi]
MNPPNDELKKIVGMLQQNYAKAFVSYDSGIAIFKGIDYCHILITLLKLIKEEYTYNAKFCKKGLFWETYIELSTIRKWIHYKMSKKNMPHNVYEYESERSNERTEKIISSSLNRRINIPYETLRTS